ncbi:MAG TPA: NIL domain-containing protein [Acidimicrobiales bacterium]|nr:NIL domain-containing protein [Acidimicrobiales bacterium]
MNSHEIAERVRLTFPAELVRQPIMGQLVRRFDVLPNIRRADVSEDVGWIVCELDGDADRVAEAIAWMEEIGVDVDRIEHPLES